MRAKIVLLVPKQHYFHLVKMPKWRLKCLDRIMTATSNHMYVQGKQKLKPGFCVGIQITAEAQFYSKVQFKFSQAMNFCKNENGVKIQHACWASMMLAYRKSPLIVPFETVKTNTIRNTIRSMPATSTAQLEL